MSGGVEELAIVVRMRDLASKEFQKLDRTIGGFASGAMKIGRSVTGIFSDLGSKIFNLKNAFIAAGGALVSSRLVDYAANVESVSHAFDGLTKGLGGAESVLEGLRRATRGAVSDFDLMQAANKAVLLGVGGSARQFEELATIARRLGKAVGRDALDSFNDLTMGIGRQSKLILDNLGLIVSVEAANEAYAEKLGRTASSLSDAEKRQAFLNAALDAGRKKVAALGVDTESLGEAWGRFKAKILNAAQEILGTLTPLLTKMFSGAAEWFTKNQLAIRRWAASVIDFIALVPLALGITIDWIKNAIEDATAFISKLGRSVAKSLTHPPHAGMAQAISQINTELAEEAETLAQTAEERRKYEDAGERVTRQIERMADALLNAADKQQKLTDRMWEIEDLRRALEGGTAEDEARTRAQQLADEIDLTHRLSEAMEKLRAVRDKFAGQSPPLSLGPVSDFALLSYSKVADYLKAGAKGATEIVNTLLSGGASALNVLNRVGERMIWLADHDFAAGARKAFEDLASEADEWGKAARKMVNEISYGLSGQLASGLFDLAENWKNMGRAAEEWAKKLIRWIGEVILQMLILKAIQAGADAIFGSGKAAPPDIERLSAAKGAVFSGGIQSLAGGGIVRGPQLALIGDNYERQEAVIPMASGYVPVEIRGRQEPRGDTIFNISTVVHYEGLTTSHAEKALLRRNADLIADTVAAKVNSSLKFREAMNQR